MSIKQERVTEVKVVAIISKVTCDGCGAVMAEQTERVSYFDPGERYEASFELALGWVEMAKGQYGSRVKAHACGKCMDSRVGELFK